MIFSHGLFFFFHGWFVSLEIKKNLNKFKKIRTKFKKKLFLFKGKGKIIPQIIFLCIHLLYIPFVGLSNKPDIRYTMYQQNFKSPVELN